MSEVGDIEKITQDRVVQLFTKQLGYTYLGNWETRPNNSNIEEAILRKYLKETEESKQNKYMAFLSQTINPREVRPSPPLSRSRGVETRRGKSQPHAGGRFRNVS